MKLRDLEKAIKDRAKLIGLGDEITEKLLKREYSHLSVGVWKDNRGKTKKEGMQLKAYLKGKKIGLKLTTREELFEAMRELVKLYRAYKFFTEEWQETKRLQESKTPPPNRADTNTTDSTKAEGREDRKRGTAREPHHQATTRENRAGEHTQRPTT